MPFIGRVYSPRLSIYASVLSVSLPVSPSPPSPFVRLFCPSRPLSRLKSRLTYISPSRSRSPLAASPGHPPSILNPIDPRIHTPYSILHTHCQCQLSALSIQYSVPSLRAPLFPLFPLFPLQVTTMHAQCPRPRSLLSPLPGSGLSGHPVCPYSYRKISAPSSQLLAPSSRSLFFAPTGPGPANFRSLSSWFVIRDCRPQLQGIRVSGFRSVESGR